MGAALRSARLRAYGRCRGGGMRAGHSEHRARKDGRLREQVQARLLSLSFHAFEQCVRQVLLAAGYGEVRLLGRTERRQYTRHGGLDMVAVARAGVTSTRIALQVKQYERPVSRRFVDELRGAMLRTGATHGVIATTSTFPDAARRAAYGDPNLPVRLVDGEELLDLMLRHAVGVRAQGTPQEHPEIDEAYFDGLMARYPAVVRRHSATRGDMAGALDSSADSGHPAGDNPPPTITQQKGGGMLLRT